MDTARNRDESCAIRCCTVYTAPRMVHIKDYRLRVPQLAIIACVMIYIGRDAFWNLQFIRKVLVDGDLSVELHNPEKDFWGNYSADYNTIEALKPVAEYEYCHNGDVWNFSGSAGIVWKAKCKSFDGLDLARRYLTSSDHFIPTAFRRYKQKRCENADAHPDCDRLWMPADNDRVLEVVAGVENMVLKIRHSVFADGVSSKVLKSIDVPGLIQFSNKNVFNVECWQTQEVRCNLSLIQTPPPPCGTVTNPRTHYQDEKTCFSTNIHAPADYISVGTILQAAGYESLPDDKRYGGVAIVLDVDWDNTDHFWKWPTGLKPNYVYNIRAQPLGRWGESDAVHSSYVEYLSPNENERVVRQAGGILLQVSMRGEFGCFSFVRLCTTIVVSAGLFKVSDFVVELILLQLYLLLGCRSTPDMFNYYSASESPHVTEFEEAYENLNKEAADKNEEEIEQIYHQFHNNQNLKERKRLTIGPMKNQQLCRTDPTEDEDDEKEDGSSSSSWNSSVEKYC